MAADNGDGTYTIYVSGRYDMYLDGQLQSNTPDAMWVRFTHIRQLQHLGNILTSDATVK